VQLVARSTLAPDGLGLSPGPPPTERIRMSIRGRRIGVDRELEEALAPAHLPERQALRQAVPAPAPTGSPPFTPPAVGHTGQPQDIDVGVEVRGCAMRPTFFDYALRDLSGKVRYARGRVYLTELRARHGAAELALGAGLVQLKPGGGFLAWLRQLRGANL